MKKILNQKGMTLVEVLAVLVIGTIISMVVYNVLFGIVHHEGKIVTNTQVRDVADFYLESLTNSLYSFNEGNLCGSIQSDIDGYYIEDCTDGTKKITGFKYGGDSTALYVEGQKLNNSEPKITITNASKMLKDGNIYHIILVLEYNGKSKTFKKEVRSISSNI